MLKRIFNSLFIKFYNLKNGNKISASSYCSYRLGRSLKRVTIGSGSLVDLESEIGCYSYIGFHTFISFARIGRYCSIANNVSIGAGEHDFTLGSTNSLFQGDASNLVQKHVDIGHDVWIGVGSIILRGVSVGTGAVIGAGAIVTKDVPAYAVVVGVPAQIIRYRFSDTVISDFIRSNWWEEKPGMARKLLTMLRE